MSNISQIITETVKKDIQEIENEVLARSYQAANELRTSALYVLRGQRSGRIYRLPGSRSTYQASAPGEPPAVRTGIFRNSWQAASNFKAQRSGNSFTVSPAIESNVNVGGYVLGELLENGTKKMSPRSYKQLVIEGAMPEIQRIFSRPYNI